MVFFEKSQPAPLCLETEKLKASGTYNCGEVLERLKTDFKNKCYICENKGITSINIEHFIPHEVHVGLKFDWNNLFYACAHCNNIKLAKYKNIINCCDPDSKVNERLRYDFVPFPYEHVSIQPLDLEKDTIETAKLLNEVYQGTTKMKTIESSNLRDKVLDEVIEFQTLLRDYFKADDNEMLKEQILPKIVGHLMKSSHFTAIKRDKILNNDKLKTQFSQYFD